MENRELEELNNLLELFSSCEQSDMISYMSISAAKKALSLFSKKYYEGDKSLAREYLHKAEEFIILAEKAHVNSKEKNNKNLH